MKPTRIRHQPCKSSWWNWKEAFGTPWQRDEHINVLEVRGCLLDLQRRARSAKNIGTRYLCLLDSYVGLGVLAKKRSSSRQLNRVLRRFDALELASGMRPYFAYVRSAKNPADRPSRRPLRPRFKPRKRRRVEEGVPRNDGPKA